MKAAIFDMDGTLLDSMQIWAHAGEKFLESKGLSAEEKLGYKLLEMNMKEGAEYLKLNYGLKDSTEEICDEINNIIRNAYLFEIPLKDGAKEFLEMLKAGGTKIALCTNTDRELFEPALKRLKIYNLFDGIFTASEMKTSKNHPEIFYATAAFLGSSPEETWVFEDALYAIRTASMAGFKTAALYDESDRMNQAEIKRICTVYCNNIGDFKKYLEEIK